MLKPEYQEDVFAVDDAMHLVASFRAAIVVVHLSSAATTSGIVGRLRTALVEHRDAGSGRAWSRLRDHVTEAGSRVVMLVRDTYGTMPAGRLAFVTIIAITAIGRVISVHKHHDLNTQVTMVRQK